MKNLHEINLNSSLLSGDYMSRPRVDQIFDRAARCKLVYVIAGAGYGKTQAVHHYIAQQQDAVTRWMQLTESDNIGSRYWENLTYNISFDNPELALKLRELGFPETLARFKQFIEIIKTTEHRSQKTFLVLDDFHLIRSKEALTFAERCAHVQIPGACVILISRTEPEINAVSLFAAGKADRITEEELCFTASEIADFYRQNAVPFSAKDLPQFMEVTKGWAFAVNLLSLVLKRNPQDPGRALDVMKQNIFQLLETEAWREFSEQIQKTLVRLSLVSDLPLRSLQEILHGDSLLQGAPELASFIWFDNFIGEYRVHPLYLEFIQGKQDILTEAEKQEVYRQAARWCSENQFYMDAVQYYAKSRQFDRMIEVLFSYPFKLPADACAFLLPVLEGLNGEGDERGDLNVLFLKNFFIPIFLVGTSQYEEARERSLAAVREWENADTPLSCAFLGIAYSNLTYIDIYTCTVTHRYDAPQYLKKSIEYFQKSPVPPAKITGPFTVADIRSYACLVGEGAALREFDQFLDAARDTAVYVAETFHDMYYGYEDLVACEIAFFKNQTDAAKNYAHSAIVKAREKGQYSIEAMAEQYLLRMAVQEGDHAFVKEMLKQLQSHLDNPHFWNRQLLYDLYAGSFYTQIGLLEMAPAWYAMDEKEAESEVRIPIRELIVSVRYYIAAKKYHQALAVLRGSTPREPSHRFFFGELMLTLLMAVAKIRTGDTAGALADFKKAYRMSFDGVFEMFFVELGRNLRPLVTAAKKSPDCGIPGEWLTMIDRKASAYAKKADVILGAMKRTNNIGDVPQLSDREKEVLNDLYHGLSREEIAANRYLSVNTIKKILQSIYIKLDAGNNVDAIRIAIDKKLVE